MAKQTRKRLPTVPDLYQILGAGTEAAKEFARIVDLLLFHQAQRKGEKTVIYDDASGDYAGLDALHGTTGFQHKYFSSPLTSSHRQQIKHSLEMTLEARRARKKERKGPKIERWVLVTPQDLKESARRKGGGDVTWVEGLGADAPFEIEHWGHKKLQALFLDTQSLCLFYYPELLPDGAMRKRTIEETRRCYDENFQQHHREIHFVGMSVYKEEATKGVPIDDIYIPLRVVSADADVAKPDVTRTDPLEFLNRGGKYVVLGDPGSGKSTLVKFLALAGLSPSLQTRYGAEEDRRRLPVLVALRDYADRLKTEKTLPLLDYIRQVVQADFALNSADDQFFEYYLENGEAILLFDGLDELTERFKQLIRDRIRALGTSYPRNTIVVTSRIVGYSHPFRFDEAEYRHFRVAPLQLPEMKKFVEDWYRARIEAKALRERNIADLHRILEDPTQTAIRDLAANPLLLTIVALVHRVDAVLPDERVVLYQKCTETLLNTWHHWKYRDQEAPRKGRIERRNRLRMEAIAQWMQCRGAEDRAQRAIAPHEELTDFLTEYIEANERARDPDDEARDLAEEFLEFVKQRAGLLIEVGDRRYSFVHLTFQEYLTAAYYKTRTQRHGIDEVWKELGRNRSESRWHEVIRLFTGALDDDEAQERVVVNLLAQEGDRDCAKLLGGFLLDAIEPAEEREKEIVGRLFALAASARSSDQVRLLVEPLRAWISKGESNLTSVTSWIGEDFARGKRSAEVERLCLTALAAEVPVENIAEAVALGLPMPSRPFRSLFGLPKNSRGRRVTEREFLRHLLVQQTWSLTKPGLNFAAVATQFVSLLDSMGTMAKASFTVSLTTMTSEVGPEHDHVVNAVLCSSFSSESLVNWAAGAANRRRDSPRPPARVNDFETLLDGV